MSFIFMVFHYPEPAHRDELVPGETRPRQRFLLDEAQERTPETDPA